MKLSEVCICGASFEVSVSEDREFLRELAVNEILKFRELHKNCLTFSKEILTIKNKA